MVARHDPHHGVADSGRKIFRRRIPTGLEVENKADRAGNRLWITAREYVAAALYRLRALSHVAQRQVWYTEDTTLFLHRAAVRKDTGGVILKSQKIEETKWL